MRGNAEAHELIAPGSLPAVLELLAAAPGEWTPIAGGTELMVAHAAGRLSANKLVSLWGIPDLAFYRDDAAEASSSAPATTFQRFASGCGSLRRSSPCWPKPQVGSAPSPTRAAPPSAAIW